MQTFLAREQIKLRRLDDNQMSALEDDLMTLAKTDVLDQTADDDLYRKLATDYPFTSRRLLGLARILDKVHVNHLFEFEIHCSLERA